MEPDNPHDRQHAISFNSETWDDAADQPDRHVAFTLTPEFRKLLIFCKLIVSVWRAEDGAPLRMRREYRLDSFAARRAEAQAIAAG